MKCPFQTITKTVDLYTQKGTVTTTEYADCDGDLCPYYRLNARYDPYTKCWVKQKPSCGRVDAK